MDIKQLLAGIEERDNTDETDVPNWIKGNPQLVRAFRRADLAETCQFWEAESSAALRKIIRNDARKAEQ